MTVEELQVIVTAQTRGIEQQMNGLASRLQGVQRQTNTMSNNMTRTFTKLKRTLVGLGIGKAIQSMFNLSRTYEASTMQVNRIFKENASAIEAWIQKNATTFGMARADAMQYASIYGNLVKGFEKDTSKMSQYTTQLLEATTVIASNTGRTVKDVSERIRSGILGNTEAIEDLGIYAQVSMVKTSNAFKTIANGRSWDKLTFQEQQQIRVMSILEQSSSQFGSSIQQNINYSLMQLTANLKNVALNLGNAFMPIVNAVLPVLNAMALALANVTNKIASFMNALFGTNFGTGAGEVQQVATGASDAASGYEDMADAADDAGDSAKKAGQKAKNAIMGFDEVNQLSKDSGSGDSGSGAGTSAGNTGVEVSNAMSEAAESFTDKLKSEMDKLKNLFKEGFEIGLGNGWKTQVDDINSSINGIKESLKDIFTDSEVMQSIRNYVDAIALNLGKVTGSVASIGLTIAQNLLGGLNIYLSENGQFIKDRLVGIFDAKTEILNLWGDFWVAFADVFSVFGGETGQQVTANIIAIFSNAFLGVVELTNKFAADIVKCIVEPFVKNKEQIKQSVEGALQVIETCTNTLKKLITDTVEKAIEVYDTYISPAFDNIADGFDIIVKAMLDMWEKYVQPTLMSMAEAWDSFYEDTLKPVIDKALEVFGKLIEGVSEIWKESLAPFLAWAMDILTPYLCTAFENISEGFKVAGEIICGIVDWLLDMLNGLIDFVVGIFTGDWERAWKGVKEIFKSIVDSFEKLVMEPLEKVLSWVKDSFSRSWETAWNGCGKVFKSVFDGLKNAAKTPLNFIIDMINKVINGLNRLKIDIPDWVPGVGGEKWGVNIPSVPRLARGGIVDGSTFMGGYIAGEERGGSKEMVVPLENTSFTDKIATAMGQAVMNAMSVMLNGNSAIGETGQNVVLEWDGVAFARTATPYIIKEMKRLGFGV